VERDARDKPLTPVVLKKVTIVAPGQPLPPKPAETAPAAAATPSATESAPAASNMQPAGTPAPEPH
jgi:peptidyl-prolyl cis-trans isomerase A (cyclophilin A)